MSRNAVVFEPRCHSRTLIQKKSFIQTQKATTQKRRTRDTQNIFLRKKQAHIYFEEVQMKTIIQQLKQKGQLQRQRLASLIQLCQNTLKFQPNVLQISSPVMIVGDIHGQFFDLLNIFQTNGYPDKCKYLFLGDYVDRGLFCIEVMTLLMVLKIKYPQNILLLRGNHEGRVMTMNFNFRTECHKKYGNEIYERFLLLFCKLPLCAVVNQTYFAVHGGISPQFMKIKQLQRVDRFIQISNHGVICDLVWSDPSQNTSIYEWQKNKMRGCSYFYGISQTKKFLKQNRIKMIIRGHQVQMEGFNYQKSQNDQKLALTIFSAPNYCDMYKNKGALAVIKDNKLSILKFTEVSHPFVLTNYMDCLQFTMPGVCQLVGKLLVYLLRSKRKSKRQLVDDNLIEQLDAFRRIQEINKIIQKQLVENNFVLFENHQRQEEVKELSEELAKPYELAYQAFMNKKNSDEEEMYPDQHTLTRIHERKNTIKTTLTLGLSSSNNFVNWEQQSQESFGPKLQMRNNISKKTLFLDETDILEDF